MSDSVEAAIQRAAAAGAAATGPATPIVIKEDRSIVVPTAMQQIAVQCDNEANVLHFVCPRNWADIDLAAATLYINVVKPDKGIVAFTCTNVASSEDTVTFDWVITEHITEVAGKLSFLVCARDPSDPGDGYRWHSNLCNSLFVAPGIACTVPNILPDPPHIPLYGTDTTLTEPGVPADAAAVGVQLSSLSEKITNLPQADWNQNDSTAADYVKNRTHYEESSYTDYVLNMDGTEITGFSMPKVGETVTVKINGVESVETVKTGTSGPLGNYTYIGTIDFDSLQAGGNGWIVAGIPGQAIGFANPDTTMSALTTVVHKINDKFINFDGFVRTFDYHFKGYTLYKTLYKNDGSECVLYTCGHFILPEANSQLFGFMGETGFSRVGSAAAQSCFVRGFIISGVDGSITIKSVVFGTNTAEMEQIAADYGYTLTTKPNA